ncbi:MAG: hypothetical protein COV45_05365 [Deltaproteobacteria bacterium CG11_big_fil_rev_8_21_14_0_20_47_16]|nr:MAG: hypothetical protein COV45_05365 [Deltaproteobacteria bacterium CG11_big_fil_rev_8_21_14_0_20_47_16]
MLKLGIIGCGLIGKKRSIAALELGDRVIQCFDPNPSSATEIASLTQCNVAATWQELVQNPDIDVVVVATPNNLHAPMTIQALQSGKHVICEKPLACTADESAEMVRTAKQHNRILKTGFNHRHFPGITKAHQLFTEGAIGDLLYIRARYGHGGRPGYDEEWRGKASTSGGGELLDQGVHIIDLCRWFMGEISEAYGLLTNHFWKKTSLEDNAFVLLKTTGGSVAQFHTSWTQWKNLFSFEVMGSTGYLKIEGLTGSYGSQRLYIGKRDDARWRPVEELIEFPPDDISWIEEWSEFKAALSEGRSPLGSGQDGYATSAIIDTIYNSCRTGQILPVPQHSL